MEDTSQPRRIKLGENLFISPTDKTCIIAEIGQNHQGDLNVAKQMILLAKESGADCVKFQKTHLSSKFNKQALLRPYNGPNSWGCTYGAHKEFLEFSNEQFIELKRFSEINDILFSSSVMDETSLMFVNSLNVPFIKIGSGDFHNKPLIRKASSLETPLIVSTGMANLSEVVDVYNILKSEHLNFCLLHCVSSYPVPFHDIDLNVIKTYKKLFYDVNIGYSGHELGTDVSLAAVALGAKVIERHFTLDKTWKGSDHAASLTPSEFHTMVSQIREFENGLFDKDAIFNKENVQKALGGFEKKFKDSEIPCFEKLGKSVVAAKQLQKGDKVTWENICLKVAEPKGVLGRDVDGIIGKNLRKDIETDESIMPQDTSNPFMYVGAIIHSLSLHKIEFISTGVIVIINGKIVHLQNNSNNWIDIQKQYKIADKDVHKLETGQFLIPGFIDTHIHGSQYPNVGLGYDLPLLEWLDKYTFPLEKKFANEKFAETAYNAVVKKTLANGTTTACYYATIHRNSSLIFAKCIQHLGQRAFVGKVNMNKNTPPGYGETFESSLNDTKAFIKNITELNSPLIKPIITPRFALSCDEKLMGALAKLATEHNLPVQTHISENVDEVRIVKEEYSNFENYLDVYNKAGLVNDKTILAHGIYLEDSEINEIIKKKATVSHCPSSNLLLQSGVCPVRRYLDKGLKISLGTDCSGGNSCSMLDSIRQALLVSIQASFNNKSTKLSHEEVFYMATLGGATALHLDKVTGNFSVGKDFDAILVDLNANQAVDLLEDYNLQQLFQKFIYLGDDRVMKNVFVAGKLVK